MTIRRAGASSRPNGRPTHRLRGEVFPTVVAAARKVFGDQLPDRAAGLAYYAFLSLPAVLLVALGVLGLAADPGEIRRLLDRTEGVLPPEAITLLGDSFTNVADNSASGVTLIVISVPLALWSATGAMGAVMRALNSTWGRTESRGFVKRRLIALAMLGWTLLAVLLMVGLLILGPALSGWIGDSTGEPGLVAALWWTLQWPILVGGVLLAFAGLMYLGPNTDTPRWRVLSAGSVVATVTWIGVSAAFSLYASRLASYNAAWGALSVVVVTLVWLWLSGLTLLLGAEVDAQMHGRRTDVESATHDEVWGAAPGEA